MDTELACDFQSSDWNTTSRVVLVVALLLPLMALGPMSNVTPRTQPALLQLAEARPDQVVSVIVQKAVKDTLEDRAVEALVLGLGGVILQDLHIINAIAIELPARAILPLSRADGVRWVSLDAPGDPYGQARPAID